MEAHTPMVRVHDGASALATTVPADSAVSAGIGDRPGEHTRAANRPGQLMLPPPGTRIRHYELIRELGRGGMGTVYLARDTKLGRRVALKFLHSTKPTLTARFVLEARTTARCNHENIVVIYEADEHEGSPYMVLEYLRGRPLTSMLSHGRTLSPGHAVELMVPVVRALACAHAHSIVHRDLKPDNIFVTDAGTVKVLDFGIAKLLPEPCRVEPASGKAPSSAGGLEGPVLEITQRGAIIGTLAYMAPEQWRGEEIDHRADLWAAGVILFRMVAGAHPLAPLRGPDLMITADLDEPMPLVRSVCPEVPEDLARIIDRCLIKPRDLRVGSAAELLDALEPLLPRRSQRTLRANECPYAGLSPFRESDADRFFGRAREITAAVAQLREQPLLGVIGPSGAGKSSFVRAGVFPALKHAGEPWTTMVIRPGRRPMAALAHLVESMTAPSEASADPSSPDVGAEHSSLIERLHAEPGYLGAVLRASARRSGGKLLLFVDQLEELYTLVADEAERLAFTRCLASVADDATAPLRVITSIRSDYLDRVDERFMLELTHGLFFLSSPSRHSLREAITQPAEMAGYGFETSTMVDEMLDHLQHTPGALPLLQFAAAKLWELRDTEHKLLTEASYRSIGGVAGALASHADAVVAELPVPDQVLTRSLLVRLVTSERTRAIVSVPELCELAGRTGSGTSQRAAIERLIERLVRARLLMVEAGEGQGGASVEIVHESLIHSWPLLRRWLDDSQEDAAFLEQLRAAAKQWRARGFPSGLLWRGEAMDEARRWHRRYPGELPELERAYLRAVFALADRAAFVRRLAVAGTIGVLTLMVAAATVALVLIRNAESLANERAAAALRAENQVREQLETIRAKERARREAEERALDALAEARQANTMADRANRQLAGKNAALRAALEQAEQAMLRAHAESLRAQENEAAARRAKDELEAALARERARVRRLEAQLGTSIIEDLAIE